MRESIRVQTQLHRVGVKKVELVERLIKMEKNGNDECVLMINKILHETIHNEKTTGQYSSNIMVPYEQYNLIFG